MPYKGRWRSGNCGQSECALYFFVIFLTVWWWCFAVGGLHWRVLKGLPEGRGC